MTLDLFPIKSPATHSANLSPCGRYRYTLSRQLDPTKSIRVLYVMLNPSTADACKDDPTVTKCIGFATRKFDAGRLDIVNLYAYRTPYPIELRRAYEAGVDIIGPDNATHIQGQALVADHIIVAWGALGLGGPKVGGLGASAHLHSRRVAHLVRLAVGDARPLFCLGKTATGEPRHPLMPSYETALEPWP